MKQDQTHSVATVLVVDDDPGARLLVGSALEVAGFRVVTAADGKSAIAKFQAHPADCVVLDVVMPGMSGFDVCRELRALPSSRKRVKMSRITSCRRRSGSKPSPTSRCQI